MCMHLCVCVCRCIHTDRCRLDPNRSGADVLMKPRPSVHLGVKWPRLRASWVKQEREGERKREKERKKQRRKKERKQEISEVLAPSASIKKSNLAPRQGPSRFGSAEM